MVKPHEGTDFSKLANLCPVKSFSFISTPADLLQLIEKVEMVIKRMKWKAFCNGKKETNCLETEWYGLKFSKTLKQVKDFIPFENDLIP